MNNKEKKTEEIVKEMREHFMKKLKESRQILTLYQSEVAYYKDALEGVSRIEKVIEMEKKNENT